MNYINRIGPLLLLFLLWVSANTQLLAAETASPKSLSIILEQALANHPLMAKAKANLDKARAMAKASSQPLYNPEIALDYESNLEDTRSLGLSQTIDWADKQGAQGKIGQRQLLAAEAEYTATRQALIVDILKKINQYQYFESALELNKKQLNTLADFVEIAKKRFAVGDINAIELDLALLTAGEISLNSAKIQSDHYQAKLSLEALFNFDPPSFPQLSSDLIQLKKVASDELLQQHPLLRQYQQLKSAAQSAIKLAQSNASPDPTISINAGKEGNENIVSLGFSMPIFVRNNWSAEIDAAIAESVAVEQDYLNTYRQVLVSIKSSYRRLELTYQAYSDWQRQNKSGLNRRTQQLQKLWKSGDLATSDYLIQIQQSLDTQIAAAELKAELMDAWFDYQLASGQIDFWLGLKANRQ